MAEQSGREVFAPSRDGVPRRLTFFGEDGLPHSYGIRYAYAPVRKLSLNVDERPAGASNTMFSCTLRMDGGWRTYATSRRPDQKQMCVTVWDSSDGINWKPVMLDQAPEGAGARNQIWFEGLPGDQTAVAGPSVVPIRDGRWRMYFWKHRDGHLRYLTAESDDGLSWCVDDVERPALYHPADGGTWKLAEGLAPEEIESIALAPEEVLSRKRLWSNDASRVHYNQLLDRYECYSVWLHPAIPDRRVDVDNAPGVHRLIMRRLSVDGLVWSNPELVMMPDERDPWDLQFYFMNVRPHNNHLLACAGYYRVEDGQQSMDTDLVFSTDGTRWHRPVRGGWIPRSPEGSATADTCGIYASDWIETPGDWLCPYGAVSTPHNARSFGLRMMAAAFNPERLVGVAADRTPGSFLTAPFFLGEPGLALDADIRGWLRAELCDAFGRKLPGFHLMDSKPVRGDSPIHTLEWKQTASSHRHEFLRLRFELSDGVVYGVGF